MEANTTSLYTMGVENTTLSYDDSTTSNGNEHCFRHTPMHKIYLILIFASTVSVISCVENIFLSYLFATRASFRQSHLFYMAILAVMDVFMAISYLSLMSIPTLHEYTRNYHLFCIWLYYVRPMLAISQVIMTTSTYLIVVATLERFLKTLRATQALHSVVANHRWIILSICVLVGLIFRGTVFFELKIVHNSLGCNGTTEEWYLDAVELPLGPFFHKFWTFYLRNTIHVFLPFGFLLVSNVAILLTLRRVQHNFPHREHHRRKESVQRHRTTVQDATRMLIAVVLLYLVSNALGVFVVTWEFLKTRTYLVTTHAFVYDWLNDVVSLLTIVCGAIRLPMYCICNTEIRIATSTAMINTFKGYLCHKARSAQYEPSTMILQTENGSLLRNNSQVNEEGLSSSLPFREIEIGSPMNEMTDYVFNSSNYDTQYDMNGDVSYTDEANRKTSKTHHLIKRDLHHDCVDL